MYAYNKKFKRIKREKYYNLFRFIALFVGFILLTDIAFFFAWVLTGQTPPVDGFFVGKITWTIISLI